MNRNIPLYIAGLVASLLSIFSGVGVMIPRFGVAGVIFTILAGAIACYYLFSLVSRRRKTRGAAGEHS